MEVKRGLSGGIEFEEEDECGGKKRAGEGALSLMRRMSVEVKRGLRRGTPGRSTQIPS